MEEYCYKCEDCKGWFWVSSAEERECADYHPECCHIYEDEIEKPYIKIVASATGQHGASDLVEVLRRDVDALRKEIQELHKYVLGLAENINSRYLDHKEL